MKQFPFMESMSLDGRTNFFERRVSDYQLAGTGDNPAAIQKPQCTLYVARVRSST